MRQFIKIPNPVAAKDVEINQLQAKIRVLEAQLEAQKEATKAAQCEVQELEDACPECEDICAIEEDCKDARCHIGDVQRILRDELACGAKMPCKLERKGLSEELCLLTEIMTAALCEAEYDMAVCAHNLAFCHAQNAPAYIAERKECLLALLAANPDIDPVCLKFINKALACACA